MLSPSLSFAPSLPSGPSAQNFQNLNSFRTQVQQALLHPAFPSSSTSKCAAFVSTFMTYNDFVMGPPAVYFLYCLVNSQKAAALSCVLASSNEPGTCLCSIYIFFVVECHYYLIYMICLHNVNLCYGRQGLYLLILSQHLIADNVRIITICLKVI